MPQKPSINYQSETSIQVYLNSATADIYLNSSLKSNLVFLFQNPITINKNAIEMKISVVNAQIPISWYLINSKNNKFYITVSGVKMAYYFKIGNYNISSFITEWNNSVGSGWILTYSTITNKISFAYTQPFIFSDDINSIFSIIGLKTGTQYSSTTNILVAPFCFNFAGITRLNIKSCCFSLNNVDSLNKGLNRTLAVIPVSSFGSGYTFYNNFTNYKNVFKNHEISTIQIEIYDDFKNFIDFNNIDWSMTLQVDILSEVIQTIDNLHDIYENLAQEL